MIEERSFINIARSIPVGTSTKAVHKGCTVSKSMALSVNNDPDSWWCYCHACRDSGKVHKTLQSIKPKQAPKTTGVIPADLKPLEDFVTKDPLKFADVLSYNKLFRYISRLQFSEVTQRIYFPSELDTFVGLDVTGKANVKLYSPKRKKCMMYTTIQARIRSAYITSSVLKYLEMVVSNKYSAVFYIGDSTSKVVALSVICKYEWDKVYLDHTFKGTMGRDLKPFTEELYYV